VPGIEVGQQSVVAVTGLQAHDAAGGVVDVAEDNGQRGADGLAGGDNFTVAHLPHFLLCSDASFVDPLDTISAFLHDAAAAHGDVGIAHELQDRGRFVIELEEVEAAIFVWTVVGTVAGANATVIDHIVEALVTVDRGGDRANDLAGSVLAAHTEDRLMECLRIIEIAPAVGVDAQPVHFPAARDLFFSDDGNVVFRLAGDDAGVAADAGIQVDGHAPGVAGVLETGIERK